MFPLTRVAVSREVFRHVSSGRRGIALEAPTIDVLRWHGASQAAYRLSLGGAYEDNDLVFPGPLGNLLDPSVLTRNFKKLARQVGLSGLRLHDPRHGHAAGLVKAGVFIRASS